MHQSDEANSAVQVPRQDLSRWDEPPNSPRIHWTIPLSTATPAASGMEQTQAPPAPVLYDALDRRLMDTFPASDAVARY